MKKYICILAGAALLAACEQKTETTEPLASPAATTPEATAASTPATYQSPVTESPAAESPAEASPTP